MSRVRGRIEAVLGWATTQQYREGDNPARWRGHLENLLAKGAKRTPIGHYKALSYADLPAFMADLRAIEGILARSLEFLILTASRCDEVRLATCSEVDQAGRVWTIPGERMKTGREHRVPLSGRATEILQSLPRHSPSVFPSRSSAFAPNMMWRLLREKMGVAATVHGFRSTFADWAAEQTDFPREVCEMALHMRSVIGSKRHTAGAICSTSAVSSPRNGLGSVRVGWLRRCELADPGFLRGPMARL